MSYDRSHTLAEAIEPWCAKGKDCLQQGDEFVIQGDKAQPQGKCYNTLVGKDRSADGCHQVGIESTLTTVVYILCPMQIQSDLP